MKGLVVETLTVGSAEKRTGITLYDKATGDPYCIQVENGVSNTTVGECTVTEATPPSGDDGNPSDTTPPVITLTGEATINLVVGDTYTEAGATATDETDGDVAVIISGSVDTAIAGTYTITYNASDGASNHAVEVTRTVNVQ